jgi:hypothetical protein
MKKPALGNCGHQERGAKLKYSLKTIEGRKLHELDYDPKSKSGTLELRIRLYFDYKSFRHVMTEYKYGYVNKILLRETFDNFGEVDGLMLPHSYTIYYSEEAGYFGYFTAHWTIQVNRWLHNIQIDPRFFKAPLLWTSK